MMRNAKSYLVAEKHASLFGNQVLVAGPSSLKKHAFPARNNPTIADWKGIFLEEVTHHTHDPKPLVYVGIFLLGRW